MVDMSPGDLVELLAAVSGVFAACLRDGGDVPTCVRCGGIGAMLCEETAGHVIGTVCPECERPTDHAVYGGRRVNRAVKRLDRLLRRLERQRNVAKGVRAVAPFLDSDPARAAAVRPQDIDWHLEPDEMKP